ncbi:MAG: 50S ribosomal protein L1 [Candidatus Azosocius agrarius]|nr:MAG: 50S ribosomal protein L1 [Gammaproteobacteria bacterium]
MVFVSKKKKNILKNINKNSVYSFNDAYILLQMLPMAKFKNTFESVDIAINLGVDIKKPEQNVRSSVVLPNGLGKNIRVAVFSDSDKDNLLNCGADIVGVDVLFDNINNGNINFDVIISDPDSMKLISKLGPILGPRGLMPNPKDGTVAKDLVSCVKKIKLGQVMYKADKYGIIHTSVGKINFEKDKIKGNIEALLNSIKKNKPASSKGIYIKKLSLSTTMGPGLFIDLSSFIY